MNTRSYKAEVKVSGDPKWYDNSLRFETDEEARLYGQDLFSRWMLTTEYRTVPSEDEPTYLWCPTCHRAVDLRTTCGHDNYYGETECDECHEERQEERL